jgi:hypothetical protein
VILQEINKGRRITQKLQCQYKTFTFLVTIGQIRLNTKYALDVKVRFRSYIKTMQREDPFEMWFEAALVVVGSFGYCAVFVFVSFVEDCY